MKSQLNYISEFSDSVAKWNYALWGEEEQKQQKKNSGLAI